MDIDAIYQGLDTFVFDYLVRQHDLDSVIKKFAHHKEVDEDCLKVDRVNLEGVYISYIRNQTIPPKSDSNALDKNQRVQNFAGKNFFDLPQPAALELLRYIPRRKLFPVRLVSQQCNYLASDYLRNAYRGILKFSNNGKISKFLNNFQNRIPANSIPFSRYSFSLDNVDALPILQLVETIINEIWFESNSNQITISILFELLNCTTNLTSLTLTGNFERTTLELPNNLQLQQLRSLSFLPSKQNANDKLSWQDLENWFTVAPSLRKLYCGICIELEPTTFAQVLVSQKKLQKVFLTDIASLSNVNSNSENFQKPNLKPNLWRSLEFSIDLDNHTEELISKVLEALSYSIQSLALDVTSGSVDLPVLKNTTCIQMKYAPNYTSKGFTPSSFPALKIVYLNYSSIHSEEKWVHSDFESNVFPTVKTLNLQHGDFAGDFSNYHIMFPSLIELKIYGRLRKCHAEYIGNYLTDLQKIVVSNFRQMYCKHCPIFGTDVHSEPTNSIPTWPFSKLTKLKTLMLWERCTMRMLVMDLVYLTINKLMQPIDTLSLTHIPLFGSSSNIPLPEKKLFLSLKQLNYHKTLKFIDLNI